MTTLDPRLESALQAFGQQRGITPDQAAQLRAAITADRQRLELLTNEARAGHLTAFAVESPDVPAHRAGYYEVTTGVVTLPASSFQAGGTTPSDDLKATVALQAMVMGFAHSSYPDTNGVQASVTPVMAGHLQEVISSSPVLVDEVKRSIREGRLERFAILDGNTGAGGTYNDADKSMNVTAESLMDPPPSKAYEDDKAADLTFVIGHEIQHSFNHAKRQGAWNTFQDQIEQIAQSRQPEHDYSPPVKALLRDVRWDEAQAEIAGWNALASRVKEQNPHSSLRDIYDANVNRSGDFVDGNKYVKTATPKPNFHFNDDLTLAATPENLEAVSKTYFDKLAVAHAVPGAPSVPTTDLGYHAESDYTNYYVRGGIERIMAAEQRYAQPVEGVQPKAVLDMGGLGADRHLIERLGISTPGQQPFRYYDASQPEATPTYFHHTQGGANDHQYVPPPITAPPLNASSPSVQARPVTPQASDTVLPSLSTAPLDASPVFPGRASLPMEPALPSRAPTIAPPDATPLREGQAIDAVPAYRTVVAPPSPGLMEATPSPLVTPAPEPSAAVTFPSVAPALEPATVRTLQDHLTAIGFTDMRGRPLPTSGVYDDATRMAVSGFQQEQQLPVTGIPDTATVALISAHARIAQLQQPPATREAPMQTGPTAEEPRASESVRTPAAAPKAELPDPRSPNHPDHALYNRLQARIPDASEERLVQFTAACHQQGITAKNLGDIHLNEPQGAMFFAPTWPPGPIASVDLTTPPPKPQEVMQQVQQYDQQQVQLQAHIQATIQAQNQQQGPMMGGPMR